jgi:hypothetical protein
MRWFSKRVGAALAIAFLSSSALFLLPGGAASGTEAPADAEEEPMTVLDTGCSVATCIEASLTPGGYGYVRARFEHSMCQWTKSHFHFWGPGHNFNTVDGRHCGGQWTDWYGPYNPGTYCVEGWVFAGNTWRPVGLPCVSI